MRSKWLDWKPGDEIIERTPHALTTKPTEPGSVGFEGKAPGGLAITRDHLRSRRGRILDIVNQLVDPLGLHDWLRAERPDLLSRGRELVAAIDRALILPSASELEGALARLAAFHRECCWLYEARLQNGAEGILERPSSRDRDEMGNSASAQARVHGRQEQAGLHGCRDGNGSGTAQCVTELEGKL